MGKKSGPSQPKAPDPVATAQAQTAMNKETAVANANLNRIDQYTPQGSLTFKQTGVNSDGTPRYASYQQYSPGEQKLYDQQNQIAQQLGGLAQDNMSRVAETQGKDFNFNGMTPLQSNVQGGQIQTSYAQGRPVQGSIANAGQIRDQFGSGGNIQTGLDYTNLTGLPGTDDFSADAQRVNDAVYKQATSRLDPQFEQQQRDLASQLAAKGVTENSAAYRNAMDQFARQRTDAYNQATYSGVQAGANEQSRLFGLALNARQQGQNEVNTQGNFANAAQQQQFSQNAAQAQFQNAAQSQRYDQNANNAQFANAAQQQQYSQNAANAAFNNTAQEQKYNQNAANVALNNNVRQQQIQEATYLRNLPLNDSASLLATGGGVQQPDFANFANVNVGNTDYAGLVQSNYGAQMQAYNQAQANRSAGLGSIFGALGSIGGAAVMSDRRLKQAIVRVGELASGIPTYVYSYIGSAVRHFGVMAQDVLTVRPDAVIEMPGGYLAVNYQKVL